MESHNANTLGDEVRRALGVAGKCVFVDVTCDMVTFSALVDTGCDVCLLRYDTLLRLDEDIELDKDRRRLVGVGQGGLTTLGSFTKAVTVDGMELEMKFHVVRERDMSYAAVIGNDILKQVTLVVSEGSVEFKPKSRKQQTTESASLEATSAESDFLGEFKELCVAVAVEANEREVELSHLSWEEGNVVRGLVSNYKPRKMQRSPVEMKILLTDDLPVYAGPRRMSYADRRTVEDQVALWLKEGIVQRSSSEYASPIVLVSKKDGGKRLCCDYRRLNEKIVRDNFPMPLIDDVVERLYAAKVFTTLDLVNGFFHVPVEQSSRKFTSFVTHNDQYEFLFVPFGISNSPAVFSRFIFAVFRDLIQNGTVVAYMDDLIIPTKDVDEGVQKLKMVLERAEQYNLRFKWEKCQFLQKSVDFLGYIISGGTMRSSEAKTRAVEKFPVPTDRKAVQRFLGLTSYFRRFIEGYAVVAKPLSDLLRRDVPFVMKEEQLLAFQQLKAALVKAPVLRLYNPKAVTEVHTDASMYGYGAVLLQKDVDDQQLHPIQYMSRKTTETEEKYHSYELEVLAIVGALKKWRVYLLGLKFKIITDCNAFAMTMRKQDIPLRVSRWALFLQDFNYEIEHRSGSKMRHVDALSRVSCLMLEDSLQHRLQQAQLMDPWIKAVMKILESGDYEDFYVQHGVLHKDPIKELIVVPTSMEDEVIRVAHNEGHFSAKRTQEGVERTFYVPELPTKASKIVKSCVECIVAESKSGKKEGYLTPIDKEDRPLGTYHVDHLGPMELTSKHYTYIFVVVDAFSKFVWLYASRSTAAEFVINQLTWQAATFGNPKRIISDRGSAFTSNAFKEYCEREGIQHLLIATGVPRGNGQVERIHKIIVPMLTKLCAGNPSQWYKHLEKVQQTLNSTPPRSTTVSPFKLLTGVEMRVSVVPELQKLLEEAAIKELDAEREETRKRAQESIIKIQQENRKSFDKNRKEGVKYRLDELVAIKRTQYGAGLKLRGKFLGPYKIVGVLNHDRYEVRKVGDHEGPGNTVTVAEHMKKWEPGIQSPGAS